MVDNFRVIASRINNEVMEKLPDIFRLFNRLQGSIDFKEFKLKEVIYEKDKNLKVFSINFLEIANSQSLRTNPEFNKFISKLTKKDPEFEVIYLNSLLNTICSIVLFNKLTQRFQHNPQNLEFLSESFNSFLKIVFEFSFLCVEESRSIENFKPKSPYYAFKVEDPSEKLFMIIENNHENVSFIGAILNTSDRYIAEVLSSNNPILH